MWRGCGQGNASAGFEMPHSVGPMISFRLSRLYRLACREWSASGRVSRGQRHLIAARAEFYPWKLSSGLPHCAHLVRDSKSKNGSRAMS